MSTLPLLKLVPLVVLQLLLRSDVSAGEDRPLDWQSLLLPDVCSIAVDRGLIESWVKPNVSRMGLMLQLNACNEDRIPLEQIEDLWTHPNFSREKPTVIFITGWLLTVNFTNGEEVSKAFACRNDTNFLRFDVADYIRTLYSWSAINTVTIGQILADALAKLDRDYVTKRVHLIGHSLGAQISGAAGRHFQKLTSGSKLSRVTGLDPANPCFYNGEELLGVGTGDAEYVDIIVTNPGVLGTARAAGDGNFFVGGLSPVQRGCLGVLAIPCSHQRAVDYLTESLYPTNGGHFLGRQCSLYTQLWTGIGCSRSSTAIMGYDATESGLFYVDVNAREFYGTQSTGNSMRIRNSCGTCATIE